MITVKSSTKRGQILLSKAERNIGVYLEDVVNAPSIYKIIAWNAAYDQYLDENGDDFHITAYSPFQFAVAWNVKDGVRYITKTHSYLIKFGGK